MTTPLAPTVTRLKLPAIRSAMRTTVWAILPEKLEAIAEVIALHAVHGHLSLEEIRARVGDRSKPAGTVKGAIQVIPIYGTISQRMDLLSESSGGTSTEQLGAEFDAAIANPKIGAVVFDVDSPGGNVEGVPELAAKIAAARGTKPILAVANSMIASAAYWLASAADEIIASPSAQVGSIGCFMAHEVTAEADAKAGITYQIVKAGEYKAEGAVGQPLTDDGLAYVQGMVDDMMTMFVSGVATYRKVSAATVRAEYGKGRMMLAKQALAAGMIDRVATLQDTLDRLGGTAPAKSGVRADADDAPHLTLIGASPAAPASPHRPDEGKEHSVPDQPTPVVDSAAILAAERKRVADIRAVGRDHQIDAAQLDALVDSGISMEAATGEILKVIKARAAGSPQVSVGATRELKKPFKFLGEQLQAIAAESELGRSLGLKRDPRLMEIQAAATGAGSTLGSDGGFAVQTDFAVDLEKLAFETGVLASQCSSTEISANADSLEVTYIDETSRVTGSRWGGVQVYRGAEADVATAKKPKFGLWESRLSDMIGLYYATDRLLQDASALSSVASEAFASEFGFMLDDEIVNGTGGPQCLGILNSAATVSVTKDAGQPAATITATNIQNMWRRMPARWRTSCTWYINQNAESQLQNMQIGLGVSGALVYMPPGGLSGVPYGTIFGRPVQPIEQCPTLGTVGDIILFAPQQYKLIRKGGLQSDMSIHVKFTSNERTFRWIMRVNGAPKLKSAITPYKGSETLSSMVTLATRA